MTTFEEWFKPWWKKHGNSPFAPTVDQALRQAWEAGAASQKKESKRKECICEGKHLVFYGCPIHDPYPE